jgi:hypothetical protein
MHAIPIYVHTNRRIHIYIFGLHKHKSIDTLIRTYCTPMSQSKSHQKTIRVKTVHSICEIAEL